MDKILIEFNASAWQRFLTDLHVKELAWQKIFEAWKATGLPLPADKESFLIDPMAWAQQFVAKSYQLGEGHSISYAMIELNSSSKALVNLVKEKASSLQGFARFFKFTNECVSVDEEKVASYKCNFEVFAESEVEKARFQMSKEIADVLNTYQARCKELGTLPVGSFHIPLQGFLDTAVSFQSAGLNSTTPGKFNINLKFIKQ